MKYEEMMLRKQNLERTKVELDHQLALMDKMLEQERGKPENKLPPLFVLRVGPEAKPTSGENGLHDVAFCYGGEPNGPPYDIAISSVASADATFADLSSEYGAETYFLVEVRQVYHRGEKLKGAQV